VYSDFYEIPLPALHFEKTEEIDIKVKNDTEERNDASKQKNDTQRNIKTALSKWHAEKRHQNRVKNDAHRSSQTTARI